MDLIDTLCQGRRDDSPDNLIPIAKDASCQGDRLSIALGTRRHSITRNDISRCIRKGYALPARWDQSPRRERSGSSSFLFFSSPFRSRCTCIRADNVGGSSESPGARVSRVRTTRVYDAVARGHLSRGAANVVASDDALNV